jgi:ADP-heptose:LPS heptosyltransferase
MDIPFADAWLTRRVRSLQKRSGQVRPLAELDLARIERVLLVLTTGLGDAVLSSAVFPAIRQALPNADIRLFCRGEWKELFEHHPDLDGLIPYPGKYRHFRATRNALRTFGPQLTLVLHGNDPDIIPLAFLAGSRYILRIPWSKTRYPFLLSNTEREEDARTIPGKHYIDNRLRILDSIGVPPVTRAPSITLDTGARRIMEVKLVKRFGRAVHYWVYHAFAADPYKVWPLAKARELLERMLTVSDDQAVVLTGSRADRERLQALCEPFHPNKVVNLAGELTLAETAATIASARYLVGPDTGILHLAAALDVPVVGLYGATSAVMVGPRSPSARHAVIQKPLTCYPCRSKKCPHDPATCMDQISVNEVIEAIRSLDHRRQQTERP